MTEFHSQPLLTVRLATLADVPAVHALILELAVFERLAHEVVATEASTREALFGVVPSAEALVAEVGGEVAGFALYYAVYSTFAGRTGLYLEDVFVRDGYRRAGVGRALMEGFFARARQRGCEKVEWRVLTWNEVAIKFYESLGAVVLRDWVPVRLGLEAGAPTGGQE